MWVALRGRKIQEWRKVKLKQVLNVVVIFCQQFFLPHSYIIPYEYLKKKSQKVFTYAVLRWGALRLSECLPATDIQ